MPAVFKATMGIHKSMSDDRLQGDPAGGSEPAAAPVGGAAADADPTGFFDLHPDPLLRLDAAGRVTNANAAARGLFGWRPGVEHTLPAAISAVVTPKLAAALATRRPMSGAASLAQSNHDAPVPLELRLVPEPAGSAALCAIRDASREQDELNALRRRESELLDLVETSGIGLHWVGPDGTVMWANQAQLDALGYERDAYVGRAAKDLYLDQAAFDAVFDRLARGEAVTDQPMRMRAGDGSVRDVVVSSSALFRDGEFAHTRCFIVDVTERGRMERELLENARALDLERSRLAGVFMHAPALIATMRGPELVYEIANPAYLAAIGRAEVRGRRVRDVMPELLEQGYLARLEEVYRSGRPYVGREERITLRDPVTGGAREVYLDFIYHPLKEADGSVSSIFFHGVDVTQQVLARRQVQAALGAKSDFLATMSHELRTPLNAMIGYADLLLAGIPEAIPRAPRNQVERIALSARHLLQLIEEILTYSRVEAGREIAVTEVVDVGDLLAEVGAIIEPLAQAKGLEFEIAQPRRGTRTLTTDPRKLRQILLNLVGNAVKFTEAGTISVRSRAGRRWMRFIIADTGIGIDPAELGTIFEPFWQADRSRTSRTGGTGLGLTLAREFARMLGGDIEVESEPGLGSTFVLRLPRERAGVGARRARRK